MSTATNGSSAAGQHDDDDDEDMIEDDQLEEYEEMISNLGSFPDKVAINSLTMVAEDHAESKKSATAIYTLIRKRLLSSSRDKLLPLIYVLDSLLKNAKGFFVEIVENDAVQWLPVVYKQLQDAQRAKLERVWKIWGQENIFSSESLKDMGTCFEKQQAVVKSTSVMAGTIVNRSKSGSLILSAELRNEMQNILDELQRDDVDELDKVSLERLADVNPEMLATIQTTAEGNLRSGSQQPEQPEEDVPPSFLIEYRSPETIARSNAWNDLKWDHLKQSHDCISKLQGFLRTDTGPDKLYTQQEALDMEVFLAAAAATASLLTASLEQVKNQEDVKAHKRTLSFPNTTNNARTAGFVSEFTNEGIKTKHDIIISLLYEGGLPFVSSEDGRRFASQVDLSNHIDSIFKRKQVEKSGLTATEERDWYVSDLVWTGETRHQAETPIGAGKEETDLQHARMGGQKSGMAAGEDGYSPETSTMPADEGRDRCVICGINFQMFFDNDSSMYEYSNCREIRVLNDDAAENEFEEVLVHITCWRGLGSPELLTADQILQDMIHQ